MALDIGPAPGGGGGASTGLTGFRRYNPDGSYTIEYLGDRQTIGEVPRWQGDIRTPRVALYYEGDENEPYNWQPGGDEQYGLMVGLVSAGYMGKDQLNRGWTTTASNALKRAMEDANRYGISLNELLGGLADVGGGGGSRGGGGGGGGGLAISDEDIRALANQTAQQVIGRNLRDDELGGFIPAFRGVIGGGTSPQVAAENLIRQDTQPGEAAAHDVGNVLGVLNQMIGGR